MNLDQPALRPRKGAPIDLTQFLDARRLEATAALDGGRRAEMGQVMTPAPVARLMASMLRQPCDHVRLLDPGAGTGSLTAAAVSALLNRDQPPASIEVVTYELDPVLVPYLKQTLDACSEASSWAGVTFRAHLEPSDFLAASAERVQNGVPGDFTCAILNPPYRKIRSSSNERALSRAIGLEVSNLYAAFVGASVHLLRPEGELVAITPRSFANGSYFRAFRRFLLERVALRRLHVFDSRDRAFRDDAVLQETVIVHAERTDEPPDMVDITASEAPDEPVRARRLPWGRVVYEHDPEQFVHLILDSEGDSVAQRMAEFDHYLSDLGLAVSTGPVVDFRAPKHLRHLPDDKTVPLLYPMHMRAGAISWPRPERAKWNALALDDDSYSLTVPRGDYVLVKRFTAKEERRRVVAAVLEAKVCPTDRVGLENHINYFHQDGEGIPLDLARGLALYLNSSLVDAYFRQFSGHTQVNAGDLRNMPYPSREHLEAAGREIVETVHEQVELDALAERLLF